jgi:sulfur carrier protein ThiS adenylyltransferase
MAAIVIGVGAVGRQVALGLGAAGIGELHLYDFDSVGPENLANQGFRESEIKAPKVDAVADAVRANNPGVHVIPINRPFAWDVCSIPPELLRLDTAVFCCVDSITTRKEIWDGLPAIPYFFCDGRMSGETMRVLSIWDAESNDAYGGTFFTADEAHAGTCTTRSSWFTANIAAGYMIAQFSKRLRDLYVAMSPDIQVNLLSSDILVAR